MADGIDGQVIKVQNGESGLGGLSWSSIKR